MQNRLFASFCISRLHITAHRHMCAGLDWRQGSSSAWPGSRSWLPRRRTWRPSHTQPLSSAPRRRLQCLWLWGDEIAWRDNAIDSFYSFGCKLISLFIEMDIGQKYFSAMGFTFQEWERMALSIIADMFSKAILSRCVSFSPLELSILYTVGSIPNNLYVFNGGQITNNTYSCQKSSPRRKH